MCDYAYTKYRQLAEKFLEISFSYLAAFTVFVILEVQMCNTTNGMWDHHVWYVALFLILNGDTPRVLRRLRRIVMSRLPSPPLRACMQARASGPLEGLAYLPLDANAETYMQVHLFYRIIVETHDPIGN